MDNYSFIIIVNGKRIVSYRYKKKTNEEANHRRTSFEIKPKLGRIDKHVFIPGSGSGFFFRNRSLGPKKSTEPQHWQKK